MPATAKPKSKSKPEPKPPAQTLDIAKAIKNAVLERLGTPANFHRLDIKHVGFPDASPPDHRFRVNLWAEIKEFQHLITDSFYITASPEGGIVSSNPKIEKKYEKGDRAHPVIRKFSDS
jgi:hypothetical protein